MNRRREHSNASNYLPKRTNERTNTPILERPNWDGSKVPIRRSNRQPDYGRLHTKHEQYGSIQERICTDPKENTDDALRFAVAFEEGLNQQESYEGIRNTIRRVNVIEQCTSQLTWSSEDEADHVVLHIDGGGTLTFLMKGKSITPHLTQ